jgi:hypothetical protein
MTGFSRAEGTSPAGATMLPSDHTGTQGAGQSGSQLSAAELIEAPTRPPGTDPKVRREERGRQDVHVRAASTQSDEFDLRQQATSASATRSQIARELLQPLSRMPAVLGTPGVVVHIQRLKRELVKAHRTLGSYPSEAAFLGLVSLIESALASKNWKGYDGALVASIRSAIELGYQKPELKAEDLRAVQLRFSSFGVQTIPEVNLNTLGATDLLDDDE